MGITDHGCGYAIFRYSNDAIEYESRLLKEAFRMEDSIVSC